jgi:hypothetical protein
VPFDVAVSTMRDRLSSLKRESEFGSRSMVFAVSLNERLGSLHSALIEKLRLKLKVLSIRISSASNIQSMASSGIEISIWLARRPYTRLNARFFMHIFAAIKESVQRTIGQ